MLKKGEKLEQLGDRIAVITTKDIAFGHDALLLAAFAKPKPGTKICDFGTGCGVIPLYWCLDTRHFEADAVEIFPAAAEMAARSVRYCGEEKRIHILCGDYLEPGLLRPGSYDMVVCNPPYFGAGTGAVSPSAEKRLARHEGRTTLGSVIEHAARVLKNGGRLCLCQRPERLAECIDLMRRNGLEPKRLCFVQQRADVKPWLFLLEAKRSARVGLCVEPVFLVEQDGALSPAMQRVYHGEKAARSRAAAL